jgi:hypothetical protein
MFVCEKDTRCCTVEINYFAVQLKVTAAERSKARSVAGIVGSNPTQGMDVCCVCMRFSVFVLLFV